MADFTGNHLLSDKVRHRLNRQATSQLQPTVPAPTPIPDTEMPESLLSVRTPSDSTGTESQPDLHRRQSYQAPFTAPQSTSNPTSRTISMMEFGAGGDVTAPFQFAQPSIVPDSTNPAMSRPVTSLDQPGPILPMAVLPNDMMGSMVSSSLATTGVNPMVSSQQDMSVFDSPTFDDSFRQSRMDAVGPDFAMGVGAEDSSMRGHPSHQPPADTSAEDVDMLTFSNAVSPTDGISSGSSHPFSQNPSGTDRSDGINDNLGPASHDLAATAIPPNQPLSFPLPAGKATKSLVAQTSSTAPRAAQGALAGPQPLPQMGASSIYSKSGFDMLRALQKVANRKEPEVNIGAVDMSCAFVVCDVTLNDCPIVYASDSFQNLTGYSRHEIFGRNCRFLQAPGGNVEAGVKREFVDDASVYRLKQAITTGREVQLSLINYRKGGRPFLNLLTAIPIPWDTDEIRYIIGFQIDVVECPAALSSSHGAGGVKVDYTNNELSQYIWEPPVSRQPEPENGQTLGMDDISTLLQQFFAKGNVASDWHKQSWHKMLLENADDVIHVISLKGTFQYVSPSCKRILEYDPTELAGSPLSSVCHPSDIVPVTRELKDANGDAPVNIVFRVRRKHSGYMWFESHGSLFSEQGKGRKCIILLGRSRPTFSLGRPVLRDHGGEIGDNELWTKLSTSGMFLFVSSNVRTLLDIQPEALVGTSIHDLMRKESRMDFGRTIEKARKGKIVSCKHEVHNRRGQVLLAQTFLYPGDDGESKPSFLLAQIKLIKASSRLSGGSQKAMNTTQHSAKQGADPLRSISANTSSGGSNSWSRSPLGQTSPDPVFAELGTTKCSSWQFELRQMEKVNRILTEELNTLLTNKKKRKRRKGSGNIIRECANCHTRNTPEWRRGPSGQRDLCNSCGLRWAKQVGGLASLASASIRSSTNGV